MTQIDQNPQNSGQSGQNKQNDEQMGKYNALEIESHWQNIWLKNNIYKAVDNDETREKKYILVEFPFPSGEALHVGHCFRYTVPDVYSRFLRMSGYNVLFPIGYDSFGLPTEETARKTGQHPVDVTRNNIFKFSQQLQRMGFSFDWDRQIASSDPQFYKWTQWQFGLMFEAGLVNQEEIELWWCEKLACVLANEEVIEKDGVKVSERGDHPVERKVMRQWVIRITDYAEKLLQGLEEIEFPAHVKEMQANWIGKSSGLEIDWEVVRP